MDQINQWITDTVAVEALRHSRELLKSSVTDLFDRLMSAGYDSMEAGAYIEGLYINSEAIPASTVPLVVLWLDRLMDNGTCDECTEEG